MTIHHRKESTATLGTLRLEVRDLRILQSYPHLSGQPIATPLRDDGLPLVLSAVVCLFGSWVGSDKGAR